MDLVKTGLERVVTYNRCQKTKTKKKKTINIFPLTMLFKERYSSLQQKLNLTPVNIYLNFQIIAVDKRTNFNQIQ